MSHASAMVVKRLLSTLFCFVVFTLFSSATVLNAQQGWRSNLYPENWRPPETASFTTDAFLQDFSYAGYRGGDEPIPNVTGPIYDVTEAPYNADPTGTSDSTVAIQNAINDAGAAGGGVVFLPAGTYLVAPRGNNYFSLRIRHSNVVLRGAGVGETFLLNTEYEGMRFRGVIRVDPSLSASSEGNITADLDSPTRVIPVSNAEDFQPGDIVRIEWEFSQGWIDEHNQNSWWSAPDRRPNPSRYTREVLSVNASEGWIEVDAPTRYTIRASRDNATVRRLTGHLFGVGIEGFSIGNVQHPGTDHSNDGFGDNHYNESGTAAHNVHASWLININNAVDSWVTDVHSFQTAENTSTAHMLSNGFRLRGSYRVTVANVQMRRPQYGGGGGNGYMFSISGSNECLLMDCIAEFNRHGIVVSGPGTSGNVFLRCEDRETRRATGLTGSYQPNGSSSDHHMHFSHSNLFDMCHVHNSSFTARHRGSSGTIPHALTSAHGVYWNTSGSRSGTSGAIVTSEQARYGYVIGTSGSSSGAANPTGGNTEPADILEGLGQGELMEPQSLYYDQLARRQEGLLLSIDEGASIPPTPGYSLNAETYSYSINPVLHQWTQLSGPSVNIDDPTAPTTTVDLLENGTYTFELTVDDGERSRSGQITIIVDDTIIDPTITTAALESIDSILGRRQSSAPALGYYVDSNDHNVGVLGSNNDSTRRDLNVVYRYELPELPAGHELSAFTFTFEITGLRDHSNDDYQLDVYLLDTDDATVSGDDFFYHGPNDTEHAFVDGYRFETGSNTDNITINPPLEVSFTIDSGAAFELLESFYEGTTPVQEVAAFRFNLDHMSAGLGGSNINRYLLNNDVAASAFKIKSLPTNDNTFAGWMAAFDLDGQTGFNDTPAGDGVANGIKAWFGIAPDVYSPAGLVISSSDGISFTHPQNPNPPTDMSARYEWAADLMTTRWYGDGEGPDNGPTLSFVYSTADDIRTVTAVPSEEMPNVFFRLVVSQDK